MDRQVANMLNESAGGMLEAADKMHVAINRQLAMYSVIARLEGMKAANEQRSIAGHSPEYTEDAFITLEHEFDAIDRG